MQGVASLLITANGVGSFGAKRAHLGEIFN